mmetsp:Transcript_23790/g.77357  ORF Transcript_23790/g.77357 Transcript_23790/m.77357 type:complete len:216 (+) Transcript_23790:723-1370(+)
MSGIAPRSRSACLFASMSERFPSAPAACTRAASGPSLRSSSSGVSASAIPSCSRAYDVPTLPASALVRSRIVAASSIRICADGWFSPSISRRLPGGRAATHTASQSISLIMRAREARFSARLRSVAAAAHLAVGGRSRKSPHSDGTTFAITMYSRVSSRPERYCSSDAVAALSVSVPSPQATTAEDTAIPASSRRYVCEANALFNRNVAASARAI